MISDEWLSALRERLDIVALVREQVDLRKRGQVFFGLCPFHAEKTPSFSVSPSRGRYHCFGCGASGDAIEFVAQTQRLGFVEAVQMLASRLGLPLPNETPQQREQAQQAQRQRERLLHLLDVAHQRYHRALLSLLDKPQHPVARYCAQRGIDAGVAQQHGLGWASGHSLDDLLRAHPQECIDAGLATAASDGKREGVRERMRGRLVFPIRDDKGCVVGFGGRFVPQFEQERSDHTPPKYLNTPETALYRKSELLYRAHEARGSIIKKRRVLVVEGYMDALSLAQAGFDETVACCGTALTEQQLHKLLKVADEVVFVFDGDHAGQKAARHAAQLAVNVYSEGHFFRFLSLPDNLDPDEFVKKHGAQHFARLVEGSQNLSDFILSSCAQKYNGLHCVEDRAAFLKDIRSIVATHAEGSIFARLLIKEAYRRAFADRRPSGANRGGAQVAPPRARPAQMGFGGAAAAAPNLARSAFGGGGGIKLPRRNLWRELLQAIDLAPQTARQCASALIEILNPEDRSERDVWQALQTLLRSSDTEAGGGQDKSIAAADLLRSASRLIAKKRLDTALETIRQLHRSGDLSEDECLRLSVSLIEETSKLHETEMDNRSRFDKTPKTIYHSV